MKSLTRFCVAAIAALCLAPAATRAQAPSGPNAPERRAPAADAGSAPQRRAMVLAMAMQSELQLNDQQTLKVKRHLEDIEDENAAFAKARKDHAEKLRALVDNPSSSDRDLLAAIAAARAAREEHDRAVRRMEDSVFAELNARQQAQYLLFEKRFKERVRERMGDRRENIRERRDQRRDQRRDAVAPGAGPD